KILKYSSAGHSPIIIHRRSEEKFIYLESKGQLLAYFQDVKLKEYTVPLYTGDRVIIYTDGIIEAFNKNQEMFDYPELEKALKAQENFTAEELCYYLIYRIKEWIGFERGFQDDITVIVIDIT
ncbi:MAG: serine/threonine-protein phosphatase, partial [Leptospiraceae bacterium]|nr:serine/threonine-protein phosphatase [Leptospiraceae bacterium]